MGLLFLIAVPLSFNSCASKYDEPPASLSPDVLIEPSTLAAWIDAGYVNNSGYNKVVIIEVNTVTSGVSGYNTSHIRGAVVLDRTELLATRVEGLAPAVTMVCNGTKMDQIIKSFGIDQNTTIVFTTSDVTSGGGSILFASRGYFTFRYWGFPKEKLKMLNGYNKAFTAEYPTYMTGDIPAIAPSTYSVKNNPGLRPDLRASLGEMIQAVGAPTTQIVDVRTLNAYNGAKKSTSGLFITAAPKDYAVFEGHITGAVNMPLTTSNVLVDSTNNNKFKTATDLNTLLTGAPYSLLSSKRTYVYCTFGFIGSELFVVLDAILNWPVEFYDGSWSQWGLYDDSVANGGKLPSGSAWKTIGLSTSTFYNDTVLAPETIADFTAAAGYDADFVATYSSDTTSPATNQIENEDAAYITTGSGGGGNGGGGGGC